MEREKKAQKKIDHETQKLILYQFESCPFCIKVRRAIKRLNLKIEQRDAQRIEKFRKELISEGGLFQTPCLRITKKDGSIQWMYESSDIIKYLQKRFAE